MKKLKAIVTASLVAACVVPFSANAAFVLDTGTPTQSVLPSLLDGFDYYAAEFNLGASQTITSIQSYVEAGLDQSGATFTVALYSDTDFGPRSAPVFSGQATYENDGWTGLTNLNLSGLPEGKYWAAVEVGSLDTATGLSLPAPGTAGTVPALGFAFNTGAGYSTEGALPFGMQVEVAPVPLPGALLLFGSGLLGLGGAARRRVATAA